MKYIVGLLLLIGFSAQVSAQGGFDNLLKEKDSCYFRWITVQTKTSDGLRDTTKRMKMTKNQMRYAEWECGRELGLVDCNNDLTFDEESNTVFKKQTDMSRVDGANKPFNGTCESCHMNGRLQRKVTFVNGKENGTDTTYYESGCPQVVRALVQGVENGQWLYHFDSTEMLAWEMNYYMGDKHGKQIYYTKIGDTTKWENYSAGVLDGVKRTYYRRNPDGSGGGLKREVNYKQGVFDGFFRIYNLDRVIIEELNYKDGKKDQECNYYYDDGTLLKTESWDDGIKNGEFKTFYYQGHIQVEESYKKGKKEGWFKEHYPDESIKNSRLFKKDVLLEEHRYDEHGRETYSFGTPTGNDTEDDEMPTTDKKKKKKKKKKKEEESEVEQ